MRTWIGFGCAAQSKGRTSDHSRASALGAAVDGRDATMVDGAIEYDGSKVYKDSLQTAHGAGPPRHAHMIENAMAQYRKELGALASPPVSARLAKVYAAPGVATPPASPLGRPQTPKLAKEPSSHFNAAKAAAVNDAAAARKARIAAKGGPKS